MKKILEEQFKQKTESPSETETTGLKVDIKDSAILEAMAKVVSESMEKIRAGEELSFTEKATLGGSLALGQLATEFRGYEHVCKRS